MWSSCLRVERSDDGGNSKRSAVETEPEIVEKGTYLVSRVRLLGISSLSQKRVTVMVIVKTRIYMTTSAVVTFSL